MMVRRMINLWICLALALLPLFAGVAGGPSRVKVGRLHPSLVALAAASNQEAAVIVLAAGDPALARALTVALGGVITRDLAILNAFAARLPGAALRRLAVDPSVRWVSPDAPVVRASKPEDCPQCIQLNRLENAYVAAVGADRLWNEAPAYLQGQGITVAVVDSGVWVGHPDLQGAPGQSRVVASVEFASHSEHTLDIYGHGTHVAGLIGGNGNLSNGGYIGVAPRVNLVSVKVGDETGAALTSDLVAGLQWVLDHQDEYNIRVVNLSMNSSLAESYHTSPLDAALEILWFNGIVVVVSAGNNGADGVLYPPANDPFVIVVGAADDQGTPAGGDDTLTAYSASGVSEAGFAKPDLIAPGVNLVSLLSSEETTLATSHPENIVSWHGHQPDSAYFRMSGTSMASAVTAGAAALLIQDEPGLNPDQVKYRLMSAARPFGGTTGYLDIYAAVHGLTSEAANTGLPASQLLWSGENPITWESVNWGSVNWGSVNWGSVNWGSVNWGSVNWGSDYWGD